MNIVLCISKKENGTQDKDEDAGDEKKRMTKEIMKKILASQTSNQITSGNNLFNNGIFP